MRQSLLSLAVTAALATTAVAGQHDHGHDHDEFRQHGAHVHGVGHLDVVLDGAYVLMDLTLPGADVVGFEHQPTTPEDEQAVAAALEQLQAAEDLFLLPEAAECRLDVAEARFAQLDDHDHHHHDHGHDHHGHDHSHDDHDHDDHGHDHGHDDHGHDHDHDHSHDDHGHDHGHDHSHDHADFLVEYVFECAQPQQLTHMDVQIFTVFPDNHTLQVRVAAPSGQTATELRPGHTRLSF